MKRRRSVQLCKTESKVQVSQIVIEIQYLYKHNGPLIVLCAVFLEDRISWLIQPAAAHIGHGWKKLSTYNVSVQLVRHYPSLPKPRDPKCIWFGLIYTLDLKSSLCAHFRPDAFSLAATVRILAWKTLWIISCRINFEFLVFWRLRSCWTSCKEPFHLIFCGFLFWRILKHCLTLKFF